jgi:hypothetical protein
MDAQDGKQWNSSFSQTASQGFRQMYLSLRSFAALYVTKKRQTHSPPMKSPPIEPFFLSVHNFGADYGFYNQTSVRGFTCFLLITEYVSGYKWIFCQQSKQPTVNPMLWFIRQFCLPVGVSFAVLRTDGGGELWDSLVFSNRLLKEAHCLIEPTGAYNSAANSLVEQGIGVVCVQAQICLFASGLDVTFWCLALSHPAMLCNYCPRIDTHDTHTSNHEVLFKDKPNYANLVIWGLPVYVFNRCLMRRRPESATVTGRFL